MNIKSYKFRIYPSRAQRTRLDETLGICCKLYNAALQERRDAWCIARKSVSCFDQIKQLPEIKEIRPESSMVHSQVLQDPLRRLDKAFAAFFRRAAENRKLPPDKRKPVGYRRFRPRARY